MLRLSAVKAPHSSLNVPGLYRNFASRSFVSRVNMRVRFPLCGSFVFCCAFSPFVRLVFLSLSCERCAFSFRFRNSLVRVRALRFISYRAVPKITLVYVRCCVRSFVLVCLGVTVRFGVSSFVCFHFVSSFTRGSFRYRPLSLYRSVVVLLRSFGLCCSSIPRHSSRLFRGFRRRFRIVFLLLFLCRVPYGRAFCKSS